MAHPIDCDTYISVAELNKKFRIYIGYKPDFGIFYVTRCLYAVFVDGAEWMKAAAFVIQFCLAPLALSIDLAALLSVGVAYALYKIIVKVIDLIIKCFSTLFSTIVSAALGTLLKLAAVVMLAIGVYIGWDDILYGITWLFVNIKTLFYTLVQGS